MGGVGRRWLLSAWPAGQFVGAARREMADLPAPVTSLSVGWTRRVSPVSNTTECTASVFLTRATVVLWLMMWVMLLTGTNRASLELTI